MTSRARRRGVAGLLALRREQVSRDGFFPAERDLAKRVGVSRPTLRLILADMERLGLVETLEGIGRRFTEKAEEMDELASEGGRNPSLLQRSVVLLAAHDMTGPHEEMRAFGWEHQTVAAAIVALQQRRLSSLILAPDEYESERTDTVIQASPHGILAPVLMKNPAGRRHLIERAKASQIPIVVRSEEPLSKLVDSVGSDHEAGAYELAKWLIARGRRHLWTISYKGTDDTATEDEYWFSRRAAGCRRALEEAGLEPPVELAVVDGMGSGGGPRKQFEQHARISAGYLAEEVMQGRPIDAVMVASDGGVFRTAAALRMLGKKPNKDVDLVGYDNYWAECLERFSEPTPPLATVDKDNAQIGREAVKLLEERIAGELPAEPQCRLIKPTLIEVDPRQGVGNDTAST